MTTQTVTFTVDDGTDEIAGATVDINGARKKTNASGQAVFNLPAGSYDVLVKARGYTSDRQTVTVAGSAVTKTVSLASV